MDKWSEMLSKQMSQWKKGSSSSNNSVQPIHGIEPIKRRKLPFNSFNGVDVLWTIGCIFIRNAHQNGTDGDTELQIGFGFMLLRESQRNSGNNHKPC